MIPTNTVRSAYNNAMSSTATYYANDYGPASQTVYDQTYRDRDVDDEMAELRRRCYLEFIERISAENGKLLCRAERQRSKMEFMAKRYRAKIAQYNRKFIKSRC